MDLQVCPLLCSMAAPAEAEQNVLETIFEDGEALGDDGSLSEDVEMVDAETLNNGSNNHLPDTSLNVSETLNYGSNNHLPDTSLNVSETQGGGSGGPCRGSGEGKMTSKKKRKKNKRKRRSSSDLKITDINRFVIDTCRHLREKKSYLIWTAVGCLGVAAVNDLVKEVDAIQSCGGQKTADGKRFRVGGGILWNILKTREPKAYKEIMAKGRQFEKQFRPHKALDARGTEGTIRQMSPCEIEASVGQESDDSQPQEEPPPVIQPSDPNGERKSALNRIRAPVAYDDLFEEGEIVLST